MCELFKTLLISRLKYRNIYTGEDKWDIIEMEEYGRCLIAKCDIEVNELIFCDFPLFHGPRNINYEKVFCVSCYEIMNELILCNDCLKFPLCNDCSSKIQNYHVKECQLIRSWNYCNTPNNHYSKHLFRALTVIRGLNVLEGEDKMLISMMACHQNSTLQNVEVDKILSEFEFLQKDSDIIENLKKVSCVLNTNAFEISILNSNDSKLSLRGLFPLAAVMNHCCIPNVRYVYDDNMVMHCYAAKNIAQGEQIFNSYTKLLWGTKQRRAHLYFSKKFSCKCNRCMDPSEFDSYVSGLKCIRTNCDGVMLSINPLITTAYWKCKECHLKLDYSRVAKIHEILSNQIFSMIQNDSTVNLNEYLKSKLVNITQKNNQFMIEVKLQLILKMKSEILSETTEENCNDIISYCRDVLDVLEKLKAGECFIKGMLLYELASAEIKLIMIKKKFLDEVTRRNIFQKLKVAYEILRNSSSQPKDLNSLLDCIAWKQ